MTLPLAGLVLLSAALHPLWNALVKRDASPAGAFLGLAAVLAAIGLVQVAAGGGAICPPPGTWPLLAASVAGQTVYGVALVTALRRGDLSAYYPLVRSSPVAIVAYGWLFEGQSYGWPLLAGIALVLAGGYALQTGPGRRVHDPRTLAAAVIAMLGTAVYSVADGAAMRHMTPEALLFWTQLGAIPPLTLGFRLAGAPIRGGGRGALPRALAGGAISYASYYLILLAYGLGGDVAAVASVRQASIPMAVLVGALWLGEPALGRRLGASLLVAFGIVLIVLGR
ncbi:EamA family transporter [Arenibaculum pallidiluteum]|uniref:hypothetical protein n=1 Tax=Arenibaculum pallidiluteum TaxID=2812559 RepID=UPI001A957A0F|nr:hypothetical protein [Arenibaculum pallidiluteum]